MNTTPVRSMTGFGEAEREFPAGRLQVEIRTVNHRSLNLQLRMPQGFDRHEPVLERTLREHFVRGHVKITVTLTRGSTGEAAPPLVDVERARRYVDALRALQAEMGLSGSIDVNVLGWFRDLFREGVEEPIELPEELLVQAVSEAAARVVEMREDEGSRLAADLSGRLDVMEREVATITAQAPRRLVAERDRLRQALADLLDGSVSVDEDRLAREVAHLAERWDIHEEIVRFASHVVMFRETLSKGDPQGVGKRLGFIAQEFLRETNTMGSKANDSGIAASVVVVKEEIERLREQLENVE